MKTTILLLLSLFSFALPTFASEEHEEAKKHEAQELRKEIARQELLIKALRHRLHSVAETSPKLLITIHERYYDIDGKVVAKDATSSKEFLDELFSVVKKQCLAKNIRSVELKTSSSESYGAVQDAIDACKAVGASHISIRHFDKKG